MDIPQPNLPVHTGNIILESTTCITEIIRLVHFHRLNQLQELSEFPTDALNLLLNLSREHLYRRHRAPIQCARCWPQFDDQANLNTHLTVKNVCEVREGFTTDSMTVDMEKRIRSRKNASKDQTEEDRWKVMYGILFQNEAVPSPCEFDLFESYPRQNYERC